MNSTELRDGIGDFVSGHLQTAIAKQTGKRFRIYLYSNVYTDLARQVNFQLNWQIKESVK